MIIIIQENVACVLYIYYYNYMSYIVCYTILV